MNKYFYIGSLIISAILAIIASVFKIQHWTDTSFLFSLVFILSMPYIFLGVKDVYQNSTDQSLIKLMWLIGFVFFPVIAGVAYFREYRKNN